MRQIEILVTYLSLCRIYYNRDNSNKFFFKKKYGLFWQNQLTLRKKKPGFEF